MRRDGVGDVCVRRRAAGFSALQPELAPLCRGDAARPSSFLLRRDLTPTRNAAVVSPAPAAGICCVTVTSNQ